MPFEFAGSAPKLLPTEVLPVWNLATSEEETKIAGDFKGEYRGTTVRDDAALNAWLAMRPTEPALEPDLPIIDPHHISGRTRSAAAICCPTCWPNRRRPQHRLDRVPRMPRHVPQVRPARDGAVGEVEFVNGIAAISASGNYGHCRVAEAIVGGGDLTVGARVCELLEAEIAVAGGRLRGIRHGVAWDSTKRSQVRVSHRRGHR